MYLSLGNRYYAYGSVHFRHEEPSLNRSWYETNEEPIVRHL